MNTITIRVQRRELNAKIIPLLLGKVFHVTSFKNYKEILKTGYIESNKDNEFQPSFSQSLSSFGNFIGAVSLIDLFNKSQVEADNYSGEGYYFLQPKRDWGSVVFLLLDSKYYGNLKIQTKSSLPSKNIILEKDIRGKNYAPDIECWYQEKIDLSEISQIIILNIQP